MSKPHSNRNNQNPFAMTKTHFLCLANSKKYGERCIAGIQLTPDRNGQFHFVKTDGHPKWIRPVSSTEHGEVPATWVQHIRIGDIVEMELLRHSPRAYQTENVLFRKDSLQVVRPARLSAAHLDQLVEQAEDTLFGNLHNHLSESEIGTVNRSLILVKAEQPKAYFTTPYNTKPRLQFQLGKGRYDLPITDVNFFDWMQENPSVLENMDPVFLTISVSTCFEGRYFKLAAGVVIPS